MATGVTTGAKLVVRAPREGEAQFGFPAGRKTAAAVAIKVPRGRQGRATKIRVEYAAGGRATVPLAVVTLAAA